MAQSVIVTKKSGSNPKGVLRCTVNATNVNSAGAGVCAAGVLVMIGAAASTPVYASHASVEACAASASNLLGISLNATTAGNHAIDIDPVKIGDELIIKYTGTAPTPGTIYGLAANGEYAQANTTTGILFACISIDTTNTLATVKVIKVS